MKGEELEGTQHGSCSALEPVKGEKEGRCRRMELSIRQNDILTVSTERS